MNRHQCVLTWAIWVAASGIGGGCPAWGTEVDVVPSPTLNKCADATRILSVAIVGVADLQGYKADINLDENILALPDTYPYGFTEGDFLGSSTFFHVTKLAEGAYRVIQTKLGPPGADGSGDLFSLTGDPSHETAADMLVSLVAFDARDHMNESIPVSLGPPGIVRVDCTNPSVDVREDVKSCFRGSGQADPVVALFTAADAGGTGADLDRIEWQYVAGTGPCDPAGVWTLLVGGLSGLSYGPVTRRLPDPASAGEWTLHTRAWDDVGNVSDCDGYTIRYLPDLPPAVTNLSASTLHRRIQLNWTMPSLLPGQEVRIVRKHWNSDASSGHPQYPIGGPLNGGAYPANMLDGVVIFTTTSASSFLDTVSDVVTTPDIYLYRALVVDCLNAASGSAPVDISADFAAEATGDAADAANNYWLGDMDDFVGPPYVQDGFVTAVDLAVLSGSFGLTDGQPGFVPEADFGPSEMPDGSPIGVARPDDVVDFEDVILLAINYGAVAPLGSDPVVLGPSPASSGEPRLGLRLSSTGAGVGGLMMAELCLEDHTVGVRGARAVLAYDPASLDFVSAEAGPGILARPEATFTHALARPGACDLCALTVGSGRGFAGSGVLYRATFRVRSADPVGIRLEGVKLRDLINQEVGSEESFQTELPGLLGVTPVDIAPACRLVVQPNPFQEKVEMHLFVTGESETDITILNAAGRHVRRFHFGRMHAGEYQLVWDGCDESGHPVGSGIYFCELRSGFDHLRGKVLLLR